MLTWLGPRERQVVAVLCLLGGLRVLVFSAAFPPFHSTDEPFHFDLIVKYAAGHVPARVLDERLSAETATTIVLYGTGWPRRSWRSPRSLRGPSARTTAPSRSRSRSSSQPSHRIVFMGRRTTPRWVRCSSARHWGRSC